MQEICIACSRQICKKLRPLFRKPKKKPPGLHQVVVSSVSGDLGVSVSATVGGFAMRADIQSFAFFFFSDTQTQDQIDQFISD